MITRIYRVQIKPEMRAEFEPLFQTVARGSVADVAGCVRVVVGGPTPDAPDEYAMMSDWSDGQSLTDFIGADWSVVHIPDGMEKFVVACWVHHFRHM
jgi:quinol monooxygenase YgiN